MFRMLSTVSLPMLITQLFSTCNVSADTLDATSSEYPREILYAEMPAEIVRDGEQFKKINDDSQLRHRTNEQDKEIEKAHDKLPGNQQSGEQQMHQQEPADRMIKGDDGALRE